MHHHIACRLIELPVGIAGVLVVICVCIQCFDAVGIRKSIWPVKIE